MGKHKNTLTALLKLNLKCFIGICAPFVEDVIPAVYVPEAVVKLVMVTNDNAAVRELLFIVRHKNEERKGRLIFERSRVYFTASTPFASLLSCDKSHTNTENKKPEKRSSYFI